MTLLKAIAAEMFVIFGAWLALQQIVMPIMEYGPVLALAAMILWLIGLGVAAVYVHLTLSA